VCSPPSAVRWTETADGGVDARLGGVLIDHYRPSEPAATRRCARAASTSTASDYALEEPTSLNTLSVLPQLMAMGIGAIKIEGRQRSPSYVAEVTKVWRSAIDAAWSAHCGQGRYSVQPAWDGQLARWAEGRQHTLGAYDRPWR
jgi:collagenase-like PrtC family protease